MTTSSEKAIGTQQFASLLKAADQAKTKVAETNGAIGERIKHAAENANLHPGAFKLILKLYRMSEEKRDAYLANFDLYRDFARELNLFQEHVGDLDTLARKEEDEDAQHVADNVTRLQAGIRPLPDADDDFDDATSDNPSMRNRRPSLPDGDAPGTYKLA